MVRIVIVGGGFAGLAAAEKLRALRRSADVTVVDTRPTFDFLPMLPDVIGRRANPDHLTYDLETLGSRLGFRFVHDAVHSVDLARRRVHLADCAIGYDYLVISAGSQTNLYGQQFARERARRLDSVEDARRLLALMQRNVHDVFVVAGGGYTGVEVATNIRAHFSRIGAQQKRILLCERGESVLGALPRRFQDYARANLDRLGIEVRVGSSVADAADGRVVLDSGDAFEKALLIWAAGVHTPQFVRDLPVQKTGQGRIEVDPFLRIDDRCFVAGDCASLTHRGNPLRMSIQFSLSEGRLAGRNIVRAVRGRELGRFRPVDPGYVVPMANNRSCGLVLGVPLTGRLPTLLHYVMCVFRSRGLGRRLRMLGELRRIF